MFVAVQDDLELPFQIEKRRCDRSQPTGLESVAQFQYRQTTQAEPIAHALANGFRLFQFEGDGAGERGIGQGAVEHFACSGAFFAQDPRHVFQILVGRRTTRQRMIRRCENAEPVLVPDEALQALVLHRAFDESEIDAVVEQVCRDLLRVFQREVDVALRVSSAQFGEEGREQVVADGQAGAQAQVEGEFAALRGGFDLPDTIEHVERFRQQLPTGLVKQ